MKERPILFSAPMVRAILDGTKTQTRRVVKPQPDLVTDDGVPARFTAKDEQLGRIGELIRCPYGQPGDRLWVRETWAHYQSVNHIRRQGGRAFSEVSDGFAGYRADGHDTVEDFREHIRLMSGCDLEAIEINGNRWRPSIHMPRWASRITLEVTDVRVERLQDISVEDARAEGCEHPLKGTELAGVPGDYVADERTSFACLWQSINGPGSWAANPWVWVVEFKRVTP